MNEVAVVFLMIITVIGTFIWIRKSNQHDYDKDPVSHTDPKKMLVRDLISAVIISLFMSLILVSALNAIMSGFYH